MATESEIQFRCDGCGACLVAKMSAAGKGRKCPGCGYSITVPLLLSPLPTPGPSVSAVESVKMARDILAITKANCELCKAAGSVQEWKTARKDGKRLLNILHACIWDQATSDLCDLEGFLRENSRAQALSRIAAVNFLASDKGMRRKYCRWMKKQKGNQRLGSLAEALEEVRGIRRQIRSIQM